ALGGEPVRWALAARSHEDLASKLRRALAGEADGETVFVRAPLADTPGKVAFLFAGQGSQHVDMLADLYVAFPDLRAELEANPEIAAKMFPPRAFTPRERAVQEAALTRTDVAQVALGLADIAMARALERAGLVPDMLAGHSYGELVALGEAGAWGAADVARLSGARGRAILDAAGDDPGAMAAVNADPASVETLIEGIDDVVVANRNAPDQTVLSGRTAAVEEAVRRIEAAGVKVTRVNVACAFHSPVVAGATKEFEAAMRAVEVRPLRRQVWSNSTAAPYPGDPESTIELLTGQIARPVRFVEQIEAMYEAGARIFVEVGPGRIQTRLVERILGDRPHVALATSVKGEGALEWLVRALARLAASGVAIDPRGLFAGRTSATFDLDGAAARELSPTTWLVDGQWARPASGALPPGSFRPVSEPVVRRHVNGGAPAPGDDREAAMVEYLRSVREAIEAQREVMLRYLGAAPAPREPAEAAREPAAAPNGGNGATPHGTPTMPARATGPIAPVAAPPAWAALSDSLLAIVSERTGYPVEMLDLDLDLEADLSIDSIKRIEILGALNEQTGLAEKLGDQRDELLEELAGIKTLRGIVAWIEERAPQGAAPPSTTPATFAERPPAPVAAAASSPSRGPAGPAAPLSDSLLAIVSERTGYPVEMLDLDLDLEADLSIDSIKRIEILGALNEQTGLAEKLGDQRDELLEELAGIKTLRGIVAWIEQRSTEPAGTPIAIAENGSAHGAQNGSAHGAQNGSVHAAQNGLAHAQNGAAALRRFRFEVRPAPATRNGARLDGRAFAIIDDGLGVAHALSDLLARLGAKATILHPDCEFGRIDGLVDLSRLSPASGPDDVKRLFRLAKRALDGDARWIVAATGMGGAFGYGRNGSGRPGQGGVAGFLRSLSKERPEVHVRAIDLDPQADPQRLAEQMAQEIVSTGGPVEVAYCGDERRELAIVPAPLERNGGGAAGLDETSVVLVTGGARGIAAHVSIELARRHCCVLELVGRSPLPAEGDEPAEIAGIDDPRELKARLIALTPGARPAEIERRARELLAAREIRATLGAIAAAGGRARYHSVDVRSRVAFGDLIDGIRALHGRIDAVFHAAGLIEDKLVVHKTVESFERVFDTKVAGALTLVEKLREDTRLIVFFSSAAGVFGNAGQTDYAAANDVLDRLAIHLAERGTMRAISVAWGPWDSAGMVSDALRREYDRRGIGLIPLRAGVAGLFDEIDEPHADAARVVLMGAADERLADSPAPDQGY
ncbi:MAG TPA: SDR family NAD(P)-dependent oxidoreductase, partial [Gemmatimonadota bacterium]|nr:SDR family NAD(P)-dependent oxidoreductase [Gemmatimonadota bacterium]